MGEEPGGVNVASDNMSDCIGSDGRIAGHGSDWAAKVETRSSDFAVERTEQTRVVESNLDIKQNQIKSNQSKHGERRTSPVDILRRNFGSIRPPSAGRYDVETSKVESMLDQEKLAVIQVPPYSSCFNVSEEGLEGLRSNLETSRPLSAGVESMLENLQNRRLSRNGKEFEILEPLSDRSHESSERKIFKEFRPHFECHSNQILENLELNQGTVLDPDPLDVNTLETSQYVDNNVETPSDSDKVASSEALDCIKSPKQETQAGCSNDSNYLTLAGWEDAEISISEEITKMNFDLSSVCSANVEIFKDADSMLEILDYRRTKCNPGSDVSVENDIYLRMDPETSRSNSDLVDTQNALKGGCTLGSLDQRWLAGNQRENCSRSFNYGSARTQNQSSMSLKSRDAKLSVSEGNLKSILHKNPGRIGPPSVVGSNVETHKDLDKVKIMLENLGGRQRTFGFSLNNQERPDSDFPKFSTSLELEDFELSIVNRNLEGTVNAIDENEICQSKEHVYCTVYCIANDNYRKPLGTALPLDPESPPPSDLPEVYSPVNLPHPSLDSEIGYYPEPYTLRDLVGHSGFSSVLSVDDLVLTCLVCLDVRAIRPLHCCKKAVCEDCLKSYIGSQVLSGRVYIACPIPECSGYLEESVVVSHLASEDVAKYKYFLELSRLDSRTKACPQCSLFTSLKGQNPSAPGKMEQKFKIQCSRCQLVWCFKCHAPWHSGLKCRDYRKEDKLLRHWAGVIEHGQRNAQKCPRCKIHIQRTEGCDHMTCTQCNTNFCYRCGEKYRQLRFFGDHTSNLSVFGCKYRYLPEKPHLRRFIRGSVCVSKVVVAPVLMVLLVVMGALALVIGLVAFPVYYICKKRRKHSTGKGRWLC